MTITLLPYIGDYEIAMEIYEESAGLLSRRHIEEQRIVNLFIMNTLIDMPGWDHHPSIKMWKGYEWSLLQYQAVICEEWTCQFGERDPYYDKTQRAYFSNPSIGEQYDQPPWLEREDIRLSHQSNLIRIDPEYYRKHFPGVPDNLPYIYPSD